MLPELEQLIGLQELDKEILDLSLNLDRLPQELKKKHQEMAALETEKSACSQELEVLQGQLREMEAEVTDLEEGIKTSRQRLMDINKELELKAMLMAETPTISLQVRTHRPQRMHRSSGSSI